MATTQQREILTFRPLNPVETWEPFPTGGLGIGGDEDHVRAARVLADLRWLAGQATAEDLKDAIRLVGHRLRMAIGEHLATEDAEPGSPVSVAAGWDR